MFCDVLPLRIFICYEAEDWLRTAIYMVYKIDMACWYWRSCIGSSSGKTCWIGWLTGLANWLDWLYWLYWLDWLDWTGWTDWLSGLADWQGWQGGQGKYMAGVADRADRATRLTRQTGLTGLTRLRGLTGLTNNCLYMANLKLWPHSLTGPLTHWPTDSPNYKEMLSHLKTMAFTFT